ncbi:hypothetical protein TIFTF001_003880 [Ficus carica]|uniref:[histone H3]-lysine(27) N-methyltransferase n=1 Tax=Ficus carica TaxID=3494 RepID=A0AA88DBL7_FICCA|nr:hypothetical protein TIFTF001_003880 [Ficus carica]
MSPASCHSRRRRTSAPFRPESPPAKKFKPLSEVMQRAKYAVIDGADYGNLRCEQCGSGDKAEELILCDKCDRGFHLNCLRPILARVPVGSWLCRSCSGHTPRLTSFSQKKIIDFFRIQKCSNFSKHNCASPQDARKRRKRSGLLVMQKKRRRLLPFVPSDDRSQRLKQMGSLASALTTLKMEFSDDLTYFPGMASKSANRSDFEDGGMQVLSKEDAETLEQCRAMCKRGECPPLIVVFDSCEGYPLSSNSFIMLALVYEADGPIKDMTFIAEYTGDVDYIKNREHDDCDGIMTLLLATNPAKSLVICPDKRGNIARFINGINNHTMDGKKKQNCKCVRYSVNGECRVFLVATRDIAKGERLYYDYNGYEHEYPTEHFV